MMQPKNLSWYLRIGRSLSKDRDTDIMYLLEINKLNTEKKFWTKFFTGSPIEITEITDDIANAAIAALDKENIATKPDVTAETKNISTQQSVLVKQDASIEVEPKPTEPKPSNITDSLYYNVTDAISSVAKNITSNASDIYAAASKWLWGDGEKEKAIYISEKKEDAAVEARSEPNPNDNKK